MMRWLGFSILRALARLPGRPGPVRFRLSDWALYSVARHPRPTWRLDVLPPPVRK